MRLPLGQGDIRDLLMKDKYAGWTTQGAFLLSKYLHDFMPEDKLFNAADIRCAFKEYKSLIDFAEQQFEDYKTQFCIRDEDSKDDINKLIESWIIKRTIILTWEASELIIVKEIGVTYE